MSHHLPKVMKKHRACQADARICIRWEWVTRKSGLTLLFAEWIITKSIRSEYREEVLGAVEERFSQVRAAKGEAAAKLWFAREAFIFLFYSCRLLATQATRCLAILLH